ncbi:uncharacterized protein TNCV_1038631 [Trichonephila clavipes]|uniref:Uncharacterized protein n=1 Tax=Trichonephila clavipes TaxID=2585209 RepID=A0A8X6VW55_TRICX|nr:uncharacterized protein TNCV_1038631 [Trichonephila clavipes]
MSANKPQQCHFEAPFMPNRSTDILLPMKLDETDFKNFAKPYKYIKTNIENNDYHDVDNFYQQNNVSSDDDYRNILRAGITRPRVFLKLELKEK